MLQLLDIALSRGPFSKGKGKHRFQAHYSLARDARKEAHIMAQGKHVMAAIVLVALSSFLYGCSDSTTAPITSDDAPLVAPSNVVATITTGGISVTWDASTQPNLRGYNIYRKAAGQTAVSKLNPSVLATNSFVDRAAEWRVLYEYRVTAVSTKNVESTYSDVQILNETIIGGKGPRPGRRK